MDRIEKHLSKLDNQAAHISAMTHIAFDHEEDSQGNMPRSDISTESVEMARDLLEIALSPEEAEEMYMK